MFRTMLFTTEQRCSRLLSLVLTALLFSTAVYAGQRELNQVETPAEMQLIAIVGARLIDGLGGQPLENSVVILKGDRILAVGKSGEVVIPKEARQIDAAGQSLLPGMIDAHFHSRNDLRRPADYLLKRGVTSFRDPGHQFCNYDLLINTDRQMPRAFLTGGHFDADPVAFPNQAQVIRDADHARESVRRHVAKGASAIKIYFSLPLEHVRATCEASEKRGVITTAHLELVDADDAILAGVGGIEHITSFGTALAEPENIDEFKAAIASDPEARTDMRYRFWAELDLESSTQVRPMIDLVVKRGVFVSPTIAIFEQRYGSKVSNTVEVAAFQNMLKFLGMCHDAGAKMVVGSHTSARFAKRGQAYQREMELLVEAGMSPMEVLTAATKTGAEFLDIEDHLGTIEAGKTADLLLVDGDPSKHISNIGRVRRVMLNGVWVEGIDAPQVTKRVSAMRKR